MTVEAGPGSARRHILYPVFTLAALPIRSQASYYRKGAK